MSCRLAFQHTVTYRPAKTAVTLLAYVKCYLIRPKSNQTGGPNNVVLVVLWPRRRVIYARDIFSIMF